MLKAQHVLEILALFFSSGPPENKLIRAVRVEGENLTPNALLCC